MPFSAPRCREIEGREMRVGHAGGLGRQGPGSGAADGGVADAGVADDAAGGVAGPLGPSNGVGGPGTRWDGRGPGRGPGRRAVRVMGQAGWRVAICWLITVETPSPRMVMP